MNTAIDTTALNAAMISETDNIRNISSENIWFRNNVFFIFSKGCIFSSSDESIFNELLTLFKPSSKKYLANQILITSYEDNDMKAIEKKLLIESGNYHICLVVGVYNSANLNTAPEDALKHRGLINYYTSWEEVSTAIIEYAAKYGFRNKEVVETKKEDITLNNKEIKKNISLRQDLGEMNPRRTKRKRQHEGYAERIRNANSFVPPPVEFNPLTHIQQNLKEVPNKVELYDEDDDMTIHTIPKLSNNLFV